MYYRYVSVWGARPSAFIHVSLVNPLMNFEMESPTGCIQSYTCAQGTKYVYTYMQANSSYFSREEVVLQKGWRGGVASFVH